VFVRQTNVVQTQQVNNGGQPPSRAKKQRKAPIELKAHTENAYGYPPLDTRAAATASQSDSPEPAGSGPPDPGRPGGKQTSSRNAVRGGVREQMRRFNRELTSLLAQQRCLVR